MPIRPENRERYPTDWPEISHRIRFGRALGHCECEGECRSGHTGRCDARHNAPNPRTGAKVILTVAHLDHTPENCTDENLRAMCQGCHLAYDTAHHAETAARTRAAEIATWNTPLPGLEPPTHPVPQLARANTTGALPNRGHFPGKDNYAFPSITRALPASDEHRNLAACYIASRARATGWSQDQHHRTLLALFQPFRDATAAAEPAEPETPRWTPPASTAARRPATTEHWSERAACRGADVEVFISTAGAHVAQAKSICALCEVIDDCLEEAVEDASIIGVWGGTTTYERIRIRKNLETSTSDH